MNNLWMKKKDKNKRILSAVSFKNSVKTRVKSRKTSWMYLFDHYFVGGGLIYGVIIVVSNLAVFNFDVIN